MIQFFRHAALFLFPLSLAGCASIQPKEDSICSEIAEFANASEDYAVHAVTLTTDWAAIANGCGREKEYAPGIKLCGYLSKNTSIEFMEMNIRRVLSCFGDTYAGPPGSSVEYLNGKISSYSAKDVKPHIKVEVQFSTGSDEKLPRLKISAERLKN